MVDGGFYRRRAQIIFGDKTAAERAAELVNYCHRHLNADHSEERDLYRIFYYDCPPMSKKLYHPYLKTQIDYSKSDLYTWMTTFLDELKKRRKVALRMGVLADEQAHFSLRYDALKKLCSGSLKVENLTEDCFELALDQKGVDMKIGLDISSMAYKRLVDQIILISGDSDFVPAAKLARREGIDFILDPMWNPVKPNLSEHIDGLHSCAPRPQTKRKHVVSQPLTTKASAGQVLPD